MQSNSSKSKSLVLVPTLLTLSLSVMSFTILCGILIHMSSAVDGFNTDRGVVGHWSPAWFSNNRFSEPVSYYGGMYRSSGAGFGYPKRMGERSSLYGSQIYKWSPVYFSDRGLFGGRSSSSGYGNGNLNIVSNDNGLDDK